MISPNFKENKVFLRFWGDIDERLDPLFYLNNIQIEKSIIQQSRYSIATFSQKISMQRGRFGHRPRNDPRYYNGKYPFIQTGNIVKASESIRRIEYNQTLNELGLSTSRLFDKKVLVITIAANIGYTAILDYAACFPDSLVALTPKDNDLSLEYLNIYIRIIRTYIENLAPQAAQKNINLKQLGKVPVIIPDRNIQKDITSLMEKAYLEKDRKEADKQVLQKSIGEFLEQELGIMKPPEKQNTIESRMFFVNSNDILMSRFDPFPYTKEMEFFKDPKSKYKWTEFSSLIISSQTGLPVRQDFRTENGKYPYYGANGIIGYMNEYTHDGQYLIIGQDGYIGNHYVVNGKFWASNHNWVIKLNTDICNYDYVKAFLDFWNYSYLVSGGVIPKLTQSAVNKIPIVLPDLKTQEKIALYIAQIRTELDELGQQAEDIISKAITKVKEILLRGDI